MTSRYTASRWVSRAWPLLLEATGWVEFSRVAGHETDDLASQAGFIDEAPLTQATMYFCTGLSTTTGV